jgi:hypothetical protein
MPCRQKGGSIPQTIFSLTPPFHILMQFIQRHVLVDCKPYWCNAQGNEQYNGVMSQTAALCTRCCFIYTFKQWQCALILSFADPYKSNWMDLQFNYIDSNIKTCNEVKQSSLILDCLFVCQFTVTGWWEQHGNIFEALTHKFDYKTGESLLVI